MKWSKNYRFEQWQKKEEEKNKKLQEDMEEKLKAENELIQNLLPEKQTEYKLFKIFFSIFMIAFFLAADLGYRFCFLLPVLITEIVITLVSFVLWKVKPKIIKYPSVCIMPLVAFGLTLLGIGGFILGDAINAKFFKTQSIEDVKEADLNSTKNKVPVEDDYELWLKENNIIGED